jgi:hypothetical protein
MAADIHHAPAVRTALDHRDALDDAGFIEDAPPESRRRDVHGSHALQRHVGAMGRRAIGIADRILSQVPPAIRGKKRRQAGFTRKILQG